MATLPLAQPAARNQLRAPALLRLWHLTSLDAPTVAIVWTLAFAWSASIRLPLWIPIVVGLSAWSCYIADRLLDARAERHPLRPRHLFHYRHRRVFLALAAGAAVAALTTVLHWMPLAARTRNTALGVAAFAYFTSVHSPVLPSGRPRLRIPLLSKEFFVGLIFTAACIIPTLARVAAPNRLILLPTALVFIALAWLNCHAIEAWEAPQHRTIFGAALILVATSTCVTIGFGLAQQPRVALLLTSATFSAALLGLLDRLQHRLTPTTLRAAADLVLLTPALFASVAILLQ